MKMSAKDWGVMALLAVLVAGFVFMCGCTDKSGGSVVTTSQEQKAGGGGGGVGLECLAGTSKTVVGKNYVRTGVETHVIQGKSFDLCCWETDNPTRKTKSKICGDYAPSPVGYSYGILWEADEATGALHKTMEKYQKDGKSCQQFFDAKGNPEAEHCG